MNPLYIIYKWPGPMLPPDDHIHQAVTCNMRSAGLSQDQPGEHSPRPFPSSQPPPLKTGTRREAINYIYNKGKKHFLSLGRRLVKPNSKHSAAAASTRPEP